MPIEFGLWRIDGTQQRIASSPMASEARLEDMLAADISILDLDVMVIGRQYVNEHGGRIDLLAIDSEGDLHLFELKRDKTPRDIVAQTLDYASWVADLTYERVSTIFEHHLPGGPGLGQAFVTRFGLQLPDPVNTDQHLYIVAAELDASTERIVTFLSRRYAVPINAIFFRYLVDDGREYLARTWLIDPRDAEAQQAKSGRRPSWNGTDFYFAAGESTSRNWDDMVRYGFISAGGGRRYSGKLDLLQPTSRVFACIPGTKAHGYVGVGKVVETAVPVSEFKVDVDGQRVPLLTQPLVAPSMGEAADDPEKSEYAVRVEWLATQPRDKAVWTTGMFANQNVVCALRDPFTLDQLRKAFPAAVDELE